MSFNDIGVCAYVCNKEGPRFSDIALLQGTCALQEWEIFSGAEMAPDTGTDILAAVGRLYRQGMGDAHPDLMDVFNDNGPRLVECLLEAICPDGWIAEHMAVVESGWSPHEGINFQVLGQVADLDDAVLAVWAAKQVAGYRSERFDDLVEGVNRCRDALLAEPELYREAADWAARHVEARDRMLAHVWPELYASSRWLEAVAAEA